MPKHDQRQKWLLTGLLPGLAGIGSIAAAGWAVSRWMRRPRPVPRKSALVPADQTPQIAVTGAPAPVIQAAPVNQAAPVTQAAQVNRAAPVNRTARENLAAPETDTEKMYPGRVEERDMARTAAGVAEKPQKEQSERYRAERMEQPAENLPAGYALENTSAETASYLVLLIPFVALAIAIAALSFYRTPVQSSVAVPGGNAVQGRVYLQAWGCGSCHTIPGVDGADGKVGPNLGEVGIHSFIAGHLQNTPDNMIQWIMHPQQVSPGTAMPNTGVPDSVARDMAAYLYSLNSRQRSSSLNFNRR